jgi:Uma2 family endonuclease
MVALLSVIRRVRIISFGSATMKKQAKLEGAEPDCCFYVQSAHLIGKRINLDFSRDPPPDVVVEIDVHHKSTDKFGIYAALGVPEMWLYDEQRMRFYLLCDGQYSEVERSLALPMLTSQILTEFLARSRDEDQYDVLLAFEEWLNQHA